MPLSLIAFYQFRLWLFIQSIDKGSDDNKTESIVPIKSMAKFQNR